MVTSKHTAYITSIARNEVGNTVITASNGKPSGPPFVSVTVPEHAVKNIHVGQMVTMEVTV